MSETVDDVAKYLKSYFRSHMPSGSDLTAAAVANIVGGHNATWVRTNFSDIVEQAQVAAYEAYRDAERRVGGDALITVFEEIVAGSKTPIEVLQTVAAHFDSLDRFFLSLTQGRRPRAGNAFENVLKPLFTLLEYPFTHRPALDGRPDFVFPSKDFYEKNPLNSVVFTAKRTLRERWRQIVTEGAQGTGFYLATIDDAVSGRDLEDMQRSKIYLVVPRRLKNAVQRYATAGNVISFEVFLRLHLDPAAARWNI